MNFLKRHSEDAFALRYMADIGHFEFGALHRPIRFEELGALIDGLNPTDLDYWLAYWIAAFEHVALRRGHVHLVDYDRLCIGPERAVGELCELLEIDAAAMSEIASHFRPPPLLKPELETYRSPLRDRAETLHETLVEA